MSSKSCIHITPKRVHTVVMHFTPNWKSQIKVNSQNNWHSRSEKLRLHKIWNGEDKNGRSLWPPIFCSIPHAIPSFLTLWFQMNKYGFLWLYKFSCEYFLFVDISSFYSASFRRWFPRDWNELPFHTTSYYDRLCLCFSMEQRPFGSIVALKLNCQEKYMWKIQFDSFHSRGITNLTLKR